MPLKQHRSFLFDGILPEVELPSFITNTISTNPTHREDANGKRQHYSCRSHAQLYRQEEAEHDSESEEQKAEIGVNILKKSNPKSIILSEADDGFVSSKGWPQGDISREEKSRIYSKNYRTKRKERLRELEEENGFLKHKIDELSFRLQQTELQLTRLKHEPIEQCVNYHQMRENYLKHVEQTLKKQDVSEQELCALQKEMGLINSLDNKNRMELLNYHMGELLDNIIPISAFYFIDSLIKQEGIWVENDKELRRIDREMVEIMGLETEQQQREARNQLPDFMKREFVRFHEQWIDLYEAYVKMINQGTFIESICKGSEDKFKGLIKKHAMFNMELHMEKVKYRKDMREMKQSWYRKCSLSSKGRLSEVMPTEKQTTRQPNKKKHL